MTLRVVKVVVAVAGLALASACSRSSGGDDATTAPARDVASSPGVADPGGSQSEAAAADGSASAPTGGGSASFAVDATTTSPAALGRDVVSTATMTVAVDDIAAARAQAAAAAEGAGGYVHSEQGQFGDAPSATLTLKVPPERFRSVLVDLGGLGEVERQDVTTEDVTEQVIDLDSRIASAEASVARVRGFLDRATNVLEISSLEAELLRRETDLERLRGQKRGLDVRVDLATIVLTVQPPAAVAPAPEEPSDPPGFTEGLRAGWSAFVSFGRVALATVGALLPWLVPAGMVVAVVWLIRRTRRLPTADSL